MSTNHEDEKAPAQGDEAAPEQETPEETEFERRVEIVFEAFRGFLNAYEKANPDFLTTTFFLYLLESLKSLRHYVEDPEETGITWKTPAAELRYPVNIDPETLTTAILTINREELLPGVDENLGRKFGEAFVTGRNLFFLERITGFVVTRVQGENVSATLLPRKDVAPLLERWETLPPKKAEKEFDRFVRFTERTLKKSALNPFTLGPLPLVETNEKTGKKTKGTVALHMVFQPLVIDVDAGESYYPVVVELRFRRLHPEAWSEEDRAQLWEALFEVVRKAAPEEKLPELPKGEEPTVPKEAPPALPEPPLPAPDVFPKEKTTRLIRSSPYIEEQKRGRPTPPAQEALPFDGLDLLPNVRAELEEHGVKIVGIDPSIGEGHALHAIQALLDETGYRGNLKGVELRGDDNAFRFTGYLPSLRFSVTRYLELYGLTKKDRGRGLEFLPNERAEALQHLRMLAEKRYLLTYSRRYVKDGKPLVDGVRTVRSLLSIVEGWKALTPKEWSAVERGSNAEGTDEKLRFLAIEPAPILVDQIEQYYILKPANYRQEIRLLVPKTSRYVYNFVDFLMLEADRKRRGARRGTEKNPDTIRRHEKVLAQELRMDAWVQNRQWKQIRGSLKKCCEAAQALGWLTSYAFDTGTAGDVVELRLNLDKFRQAAEAQDVKALPAPAVHQARQGHFLSEG